ncbi:DUF192 domain-containing protein [Sphingobium sp. AP49]|uniref:DUF192 domain-containing protein n=1 Tax=Sphingobium sp. AP49 TaxID=1144307 RepID=UPI00026ECD6D|nr:DUF192 domain-containing protein [Sphingobium sp. AP49]WHO39943.1 DUF192 domain-containing protein [Sphingobium sp. AP49]
MTIARLPFALLPLLAACSASPGNDNSNDTPALVAQTALLPLVIHTAKGPRHFSVEVARTEAEQEQGLMFRKTLDADGGMLFPMAPPRTASFWMKNTIIPLDIIFVHTDGTIAFIGANAVPYSREPVSAGVPVAAVLELRGGRTAELGIETGDQLAWGTCAAADGKSAVDLNFCPAPAR